MKKNPILLLLINILLINSLAYAKPFSYDMNLTSKGKFNDMGGLSGGSGDWTPEDRLDGQLPSLWLKADQGVYTGGARQFYSADKGHLQIADNAALSMGDIDFTIAGWVYFDSDATMDFFGQWSATSNQRSYVLERFVTDDKIYFVVSNDGTATSSVASAATSLSTWYFVVCEHNATANTITISLNDGTAVSAAHTTGVFNSSANFQLGANADAANYMNGRMAKAAIWKRTLTAAERTWLYNSGNGRVYGELGVAGTDGSALTTSLQAYWNLNEVSGTSNAIDAHSTNDLTPTFAELLSNTGFETAGGGGADVFGSWTEEIVGTGAIADEGTIVDAGSHAAKLTGVDASNYSDLQQNVATIGHRYTWSVRARYGAAGTAKFFVGSGAGSGTTLSLTGSYATYTGTVTATTDGLVLIQSPLTANDAYFDTVSVKAVDIPAADGPESEIAADSVGTAHGVLTNFANPETAWSSDQPSAIAATVDGSLAFDGTNDYVAVPAITGLGSTQSFSVWVKSSFAAGMNQYVFDEGSNKYQLQIYDADDSNGFPKVAWNGILGTTELQNANTWYHIAGTYNGTTLKTYINGVIDINEANAGATIATVNIGRYPGGGGANYFAGNICDLRFYTTALSQSQVDELYAGGEATGATPVARYKLDDGPQSGIADGDPVIRWTSLEGSYHDFEQATASKRPLYVASAINSKPGIDFDGTDDLLVKASAFLTGTAGTVIVVYRLDAVPNTYQVALSSSDEALTTKHLILYARGNTANNHLGYQHNNAGTSDVLDGDTVVNVDTDYVMVFASNGSTITARLSGTAQTLNEDSGANEGDWWDDATGKDNVTIGASKHSSEGNFLSGKIAEILVYPNNISQAAINTKLSPYLTEEYAVAA